MAGNYRIPTDAKHFRDDLRFVTLDAINTLSLVLLVKASILTVASAAFHATGHTNVVEIKDVNELLVPSLGSLWTPVISGIGLFASGQSSTFTGTITGEVIMEEFLNMKIPCWQRR